MAKSNHPIKHEEFEHLVAETQKLQDELAVLYFEKDELQYHICKNIEMAYMLKIGALEYNIFEKECQILRIKRKIELVVQKINRQEIFIVETIEKQLDKEYAEYTEKLKSQYEAFQNAIKRKEAGFLSEEKTREIKRLYNVIVKKLHPDLLPKPDKKKNDLYIKAVEAYKTGDYEVLSAISLMIDKPDLQTVKAGTLEELQNRMKSLHERITKINIAIADIKKTFPYDQKDFLDSPEQVELKKTELSQKLNDLTQILNEYENKLHSLLGGNNG
jgi:hypothetical protein